MFWKSSRGDLQVALSFSAVSQYTCENKSKLIQCIVKNYLPEKQTGMPWLTYGKSVLLRKVENNLCRSYQRNRQLRINCLQNFQNHSRCQWIEVHRDTRDTAFHLEDLVRHEEFGCAFVVGRATTFETSCHCLVQFSRKPVNVSRRFKKMEKSKQLPDESQHNTSIPDSHIVLIK